MKIFLPPSEGKTAPTHGNPLSLDELSFPELTHTRRELIEELEFVSAQTDALAILKAGARLEGEVRAQEHLSMLPCAPAWQVYSGVLYDAINIPDLLASRTHKCGVMTASATTASAATARASTSSAATASSATTASGTPSDTTIYPIFPHATDVVIFSGLFGVTTAQDLIPAYRLSIGVKLPSAGNLASLWRKHLKPVPLAGKELVIDCRSGGYSIWNPPIEAQWVAVGAVRETNGHRTVVSHNAKYARGLLVGELLRESTVPQTPHELEDFAQVLVERGYARAIELHSPQAPSQAGTSQQIATKRHQWQLTIVQA